jgi:GT2 family glycosyltransferase
VRVSLVIPCLDAGRTLGGLLEGAARQSRVPDEILVVDDGSSDDSARVAARHGARVVSHPGNLGLAAARNTGLREAGGDLVVFLDADTLPHAELVERLARGYEDPSLAGVGGQLMEVGATRLPDLWRSLFWRQTQGPEPLRDAPFLIGACCSLRRAAALEAGGFDERFRSNGEDVELSVRLRRGGLRLAYDPMAIAFHRRCDSTRSLLAMVFRHSRDQVLGLRRHGQDATRVVRNALRWGPVTVLSSLRRHGSPSLAALSLACWYASLEGCVVALARPPGPRRVIRDR